MQRRGPALMGAISHCHLESDMLPRFLGAAFDALVMSSADAIGQVNVGPPLSLSRALFGDATWDGRSSRNGNGRHSGVAAVRRAARKRRNVLRHRRASR